MAARNIFIEARIENSQNSVPATLKNITPIHVFDLFDSICTSAIIKSLGVPLRNDLVNVSEATFYESDGTTVLPTTSLIENRGSTFDNRIIIIFPRFEVAPAIPNPVQVMNIGTFKTKLRNGHITKPKENVMQKIIDYFSINMLICSDTNECVNLYETIRDDVLNTVTKAAIQSDNNISINGPTYIGRAHILSAHNRSTGQPLTIKILRCADQSKLDKLEELRREKLACTQLNLNKPTVPFISAKLVSVVLSDEHVPCDCLLMPRYIDVVSSSPSFSIERLVIGFERLVSALTYMHQLNLVHMDVKGENVFMDSNGDWFLGDFGSITSIDGDIISSTRQFYPDLLSKMYSQTSKKAKCSYDWYMLLVLLCIEFPENGYEKKTQWFKRLCNSDENHVSNELVQKYLKVIQNTTFNNDFFLDRLILKEQKGGKSIINIPINNTVE